MYKDLLKERGITEADLANDPDLKLSLMAEASNIVKSQKKNNSSENQPNAPEASNPNAESRGKSGSNTWNGDKGIYSVICEVELPNHMYPGFSDARHFQEANRQLHEIFMKDPAFANEMEKLYPGIIGGVKPGPRGAYPRKAPTTDVTWHHEANRKGILQLVPIEQHTAKGKIQSILHPHGKGGMENWGGGRKRKK